MYLFVLLSALLLFTEPSEQSVKLATFNIQIFGRKKANNDRVMALLSEIVRRYDGIFIQEVRDISGTAFTKLLDLVNNDAGMKYTGYLGPRQGKSTSKEQIGFIFRPDKITFNGNLTIPIQIEEFERPPDCFALYIKESRLKVGVLAVHIDPDEVQNEMESLYDIVPYCEEFADTENLIILGDMNADCGYLSDRAKKILRLRTDQSYTWLIDDDADTTVSKSVCAYDRVIIKGSDLVGRIHSAVPFNFPSAFNLNPDAAKEVSDHYPVEVVID